MGISWQVEEKNIYKLNAIQFECGKIDGQPPKNPGIHMQYNRSTTANTYLKQKLRREARGLRQLLPVLLTFVSENYELHQ